MVNDVARAFFEAPARRTICVETLEEGTHEGDDVGLYGDQGSERQLPGGGEKGVDQGGVQRGKYKPSTYYQEKVGIKAVVHGDDFISSGSRKSLKNVETGGREQVRGQHAGSWIRPRRSTGDKGFEQDHQEVAPGPPLRSRSTTWEAHRELNLQEAKSV